MKGASNGRKEREEEKRPGKEKFTRRGEREGPEEEGIGTCQLNLTRYDKEGKKELL